jgi:hypothetical protein
MWMKQSTLIYCLPGPDAAVGSSSKPKEDDLYSLQSHLIIAARLLMCC